MNSVPSSWQAADAALLKEGWVLLESDERVLKEAVPK